MNCFVRFGMVKHGGEDEYLLYSSSHPSHVKESIPYSQFLRLRKLCSDDSDFNSKCDEMSNFFFSSNVAKALNRVQNVTRESALEPSASNNEERIPFTLSYSTLTILPLETWSSEILKFYSQIRKQHQYSLIRHSSHSNAIET